MSSPRSPLRNSPDGQPAGAPLTSWYTPGATDGFGDRLLMFDNAATGPVELLRVRADFALVPGFEVALRRRFDQLSSFIHPGFAQARVVNHLDNGGGLTVASTHVMGTRLSELFEAARPLPGMHPGAVRDVFGELVAAIAALHKQGAGIAHGALAADRVLLTFDRHLVVTDYVFGDALQHLHLSAERLWSEFGLVGDPATRRVALDQRGDLAQLGLLMMSVVLGRRVTPDEYPRQIPSLLRDFSAASDRRAPDLTSPLRSWLEQALDPAGFESAEEAELALALQPRRPHSIDLQGPAAAALAPALPPGAGSRTSGSPASSAPPAATEPAVSPTSTLHVTSRVTTAPSAAPSRGADIAPTPGDASDLHSGEAASHPAAVPSQTAADTANAADAAVAPPVASTESAASTSFERDEPTAPAAAPAMQIPPTDPVGSQMRFVVVPPVESSTESASALFITEPASAPSLPKPEPQTATAGTTPSAGTPVPPVPLIAPRASSPLTSTPQMASASGQTSATPPVFSTPSAPASAMPRAEHFKWISEPESAVDLTPVATTPGTSPLLKWVIAALLILLATQAVIIVRLLTREPAPRTAVPGPIDSATPPRTAASDTKEPAVATTGQPLDRQDRSPQAVPRPESAATGTPTATSQIPASSGAAPSTTKPSAGAPAADTPGSGNPGGGTSPAGAAAVAVKKPFSQRADPATGRTGGVRVVSRLPLVVLAGKEYIGSSERGPIFTTPGTRDLDFINNAVGFRTRQRVVVSADRVVSVRIDPPNGTMNVTAEPWAQVWIDGTLAGDTPLVNLSVPLGEHDVVFRHPQFGERRQTALVQTRSVTSVSMSFIP